MLTGSSALHYESQKSSNTPSIKITLKENLIGISRYHYGRNFSRGSGIVWNENYFILSQGKVWLRGVSEANYQFEVGLTIHDYSKIPIGEFVDNGSTLLLFYHWPLAGSSHNIYRIASGGGTIWGGTQIVVNNFSERIKALAPTGSTRCYFIGTTSTTYQAQIHIANYNGGWGNTLLYEGYFEQAKKSYHNQMGAKSMDNEDIIIFEAGIGIRVLRTDGINVLGVNDLTNTDSGEKSPSESYNPLSNTSHMSNLNKGSTYYYFAIKYKQDNIINEGGATYTSSTRIQTLLLKSNDMLNWSIPVYLGITEHLVLAYSYDIPMVIAGTTAGDEVALFGDYYFRLSKGSSTVDVSNNIINYQNQNNERISLTLKNYD